MLDSMKVRKWQLPILRRWLFYKSSFLHSSCFCRCVERTKRSKSLPKVKSSHDTHAQNLFHFSATIWFMAFTWQIWLFVSHISTFWRPLSCHMSTISCECIEWISESPIGHVEFVRWRAHLGNQSISRYPHDDVFACFFSSLGSRWSPWVMRRHTGRHSSHSFIKNWSIRFNVRVFVCVYRCCWCDSIGPVCIPNEMDIWTFHTVLSCGGSEQKSKLNNPLLEYIIHAVKRHSWQNTDSLKFMSRRKYDIMKSEHIRFY